MIRGAALVCLAKAVQGADPEIKLGGGLGGEAYNKGFKAYLDWVTNDEGDDSKYTVTQLPSKEHWEAWPGDDWKTDIEKFTDPLNPEGMLVHALICPYTSTKSTECVGAVNPDFTGPVFVWGGAADAIFGEQQCGALPNKNCIGMLSLASVYADTGLKALDDKITGSSKAKVSIISNDNSFSKAVAAGAVTKIEAQAGLDLDKNEAISVAKADLTAEDKAKVKTVLEGEPDIIMIAGHNGDVEQVVVEIGKLGATTEKRPRAIVATNGFTKLSNYGEDKKYAKCVLMPTQWDDTTDAKDEVVKWTSEDFHKAMGGEATYQQASAGAVGVAIANAMKDGDMDPAKLLEKLKAMDKTSFYGPLKWKDAGNINKPMYTQQMQDETKTPPTTKIVAPTGASSMKFPLNGAACWGPWDGATPAPTAAGDDAGEGAGDGGTTTARRRRTPTTETDGAYGRVSGLSLLLAPMAALAMM